MVEAGSYADMDEPGAERERWTPLRKKAAVLASVGIFALTGAKCSCSADEKGGEVKVSIGDTSQLVAVAPPSLVEAE